MKIYFNLALALTITALSSCTPKNQLLKNNNYAIVEVEYLNEIRLHQQELNTQYYDPKESPLEADKIPEFKEKGGHVFFDVDPKYRVVGTLDITQVKKDIGFETSTDRIVMYDKIGVVEFSLESKTYKLSIYESHYTRDDPEYEDYLFLPFNDLTNGESSYGGGRYIDLKKQASNQIIIDFNKSYNPYCAYSTRYSCPVPPLENYLNVEIKAGIKHKSKI